MPYSAEATQTGGAFALIEQVCPPGFANPLHMHHAEDEAFYVLEGELTVFIGDQKLQAGPGTYLFGPRDIPHGFRVEGTSPCRLLLLATPAGFEQFVVEMGKPVQELTFPLPSPLIWIRCLGWLPSTTSRCSDHYRSRQDCIVY